MSRYDNCVLNHLTLANYNSKNKVLTKDFEGTKKKRVIKFSFFANSFFSWYLIKCSFVIEYISFPNTLYGKKTLFLEAI
jgi:hypothetical protein